MSCGNTLLTFQVIGHLDFLLLKFIPDSHSKLFIGSKDYIDYKDVFSKATMFLRT